MGPVPGRTRDGGLGWDSEEGGRMMVRSEEGIRRREEGDDSTLSEDLGGFWGFDTPPSLARPDP